MKIQRLFFVFIILIFLFPSVGFPLPPLEDWALSVEMHPETPTIYDSIDIISGGIRGSGPIVVQNTFFDINGTSLTLDIYLHQDYLTVITPWGHIENIGTLPAGVYDLTVTAYTNLGRPTEVEVTSFDVVVPEPCTLLLLGMGGLLMRKRTLLLKH